MQDYSIEKFRFSALMTQLACDSVEMDFFLSPNSQRRSGFERPSELLQDQLFLPAVDPKGRLLFINKQAITIFRVEAALEFDLDNSDYANAAKNSAQMVESQVHIQDGSSLVGMISYVLPEGNDRIQDYLERKETFITLHRDDHAYMVNKRHIQFISNPED